MRRPTIHLIRRITNVSWHHQQRPDVLVSARFRGTASASCSTSTRSSIDEALDKAGLGWKVTHGDVLVVKTPEWTDDFGTKHPAELIPAKGFKANLREDTGEVLGIVSDEYEVVDNRDAFRFLDALIGSELHFETAGSLWGGRRVWVPGPAARVRRARRRPVGDLHLRGQQPRRIDGRHRRGHADPDRVRQHARRGAAPGRARRERRSGRSASATPATCRPSSPRPGRCSG